MVLASTRSVSAAQNNFPREDLFRRTQSWLLTQSPPRSISNQIYWVQGKVEVNQTISASAPTETNFAFHFSDLTNLAGLASYFDQYCMFSVVVNLNFNYNGATPGALGNVVTAIDFDNIATLGSLSAIEAYESALTSKINTTQSIQRLIHPAVSPALYGGSSFNAFGISRMWVDSANTGVPHYGYRSFFVSNLGTTLTATYDFNFVIGLRNNI
jgi:hypothetical protein